MSSKLEKYYVVVLPLKLKTTSELLDYVEPIAIDTFGCDGIENMNLVESQVNEILKERAVGGGEIPLEIIEEVETVGGQNKNSSLKFYFYGKEARPRANKFLSFLKQNIENTSKIVTENWKDWNSVWRKTFSPIKITENITIYPEWFKEKNNLKSKKPLLIYPGMGFGTGGHETTHLCLQIFDGLRDDIKNLKMPTCLDFGCGSGILGIAAMKYANMHSTFCDIDKDALTNCLQNLTLNFNEDEIKHFSKYFNKEIELVVRPRFKAENKYNLVFANILENILFEEKDDISASVEKDGYLILSGILNYQVENVENLYTQLGFIKRSVLYRGDWAAILMEKK